MGRWRKCLGKLINRGGAVVWLLVVSGLVGASWGVDADVNPVD
jgi:hypothetical protein